MVTTLLVEWRAAALLGALSLGTGCNMPHGTIGETKHDKIAIARDQAEVVRVNVRMGVGELRIDSGTDKLFEGEFTYNVPAWKPEVEYRGGLRGDLRISQRSGVQTVPDGDTKWEMKLNDQVPLDIDARMGVGEAHMNLGAHNLRSLEVKMGVGELDLDLHGSPRRSYDVRIHGGVGEAKVHLPKTVGIVATAKGGIGDIHVSGLEQKGRYYVNPGHENDPVTIRVDVSGGVGEISLIAE